MIQLKHFWRVMPLTVAPQQQHIERSEQLLAEIQPGDAPILYWSMADRPALVLGFSQKHAVLNQTALAQEQMEIYHRRAGGTAVLVGPHLLDLDVVLPVGHPLILADVVESYRWFGEMWVETLQRYAIPARVIPPDEAHAQRALLKQAETRTHEALMQRACYGGLSSYEVAVGARKIVGLDMIRRRRGTLLQAGLLLHWETTTLSRLLGHNPQEQAQLQTGLQARAVGIDDVAQRVIKPREIITTFEELLLMRTSTLTPN